VRGGRCNPSSATVLWTDACASAWHCVSWLMLSISCYPVPGAKHPNAAAPRAARTSMPTCTRQPHITADTDGCICTIDDHLLPEIQPSGLPTAAAQAGLPLQCTGSTTDTTTGSTSRQRQSRDLCSSARHQLRHTVLEHTLGSGQHTFQLAQSVASDPTGHSQCSGPSAPSPAARRAL
jgi:hypothetical protein